MAIRKFIRVNNNGGSFIIKHKGNKADDGRYHIFVPDYLELSVDVSVLDEICVSSFCAAWRCVRNSCASTKKSISQEDNKQRK